MDQTSPQVTDVNINVLLSFIAEGLIMFDADGRITMLNPHASLLLDYTAGELIGKSLDELVPVYFGDVVVPEGQRIAEQVLRGEVFTIPNGKTFCFHSRGDRKFPVFASAKPICFFKDGKEIAGGVLVFRDITVEKELEQYKVNTANTLSQLTPVLQRAATGDFTFNLELPEEENEFTELLVGLRLMLDDLRELDLAREKNEQEKIGVLEEKRVLTEKYSKELEQDVERKTRELIGVNKHIETIIENLTNGLIEYDDSSQVVRLNKAAESMLGIEKEQVVGKQITKGNIDSANLNSLVLVTFPELSESVRRVSQEVSGIDADVCELTISYPIERDLQISTVSLVGSEHGKGGGKLKVIRDITREKLISRSKSEFISIAAHQLRTPLSAIKWALSLLQKGNFGLLQESQLDVVTQAFETNEKMISLVNDLLNVARIEDGRFGYDFKKADFRDMVTRLVSVSVPRARGKYTQLVFVDQVGEVMPFVYDQSKLSVALQNLIDNAIKYTSGGGMIEVILSRHDRFAQVEVRDTGMGIPRHQIDRLFTKFFRAENVAQLPFSGSGLGLFITRNIIVRHGGKIEVHSEEGKGTSFVFTIPMDEALIPAKEEIAASLYM